MIVVVVILAAVSWLVVVLIAQQESDQSGSLASSLSSAWVRARDVARPLLVAVGREARNAVHNTRHWAQRRRAVATLAPGWSVPASARSARVRGDGLRARIVALLQLILFVVLISALFAGVIAAAALRIGHLGA